MLNNDTTDLNNLIRERINKAIAKSGISRLKVADMADVSYPNLTRFLNQKNNSKDTTGISITLLVKLSRVLSLPIGYFLNETDRNSEPYIEIDSSKLNDELDEFMKQMLKLKPTDCDTFLGIFKKIMEASQRK